MKKSKSFRVYVIIVILAGLVCAAALLTAGNRREQKYSYEYNYGRCFGYISGYVEAEEDDPMLVYIVFGDNDYSNRFDMYGLPKERYEYLSDNLKAAIDNRETGAYLLLDVAVNQNQHNRLGYDFIYLMTEWNPDYLLPERKICDIDLSWMDVGAK